MADGIFVSGTEAVVFSSEDPLAFLPSTAPGTWFYANRAPRVARDDDRYRLTLVRNRKNERDQAGALQMVTKGGTFALQLDTTAIIGSIEDEKRWTEAIKRESPFVPQATERLTFRPLSVRNTTMSIGGLESLVADPAPFQKIDVGSSTSLPVTLPLTADGADTLWRVLEKGGSFPIAVTLRSDVDVLFPGADYEIVADVEKTRKFFSLDVEATASYLGLFNAKADVTVVRDELIASGALTIVWHAKPAGFDTTRVAAMEKVVVDAYARRALDLMVKEVVPDTDAGSAGGLFGGVSVKIKDIHEVEDLNLSARYRENDIQTTTFTSMLSLTSLSGLDEDVYGVDVTGDNMLPVTINLGSDPAHVRRYLCQFGYRREDGTFSGDSAEATGQDGLLLNGVVQWSPADPKPEQTEIQFAWDLEKVEFDDGSRLVHRDNGDSGVLFQFTPGSYMKTIAVVTDFPKAPEGSIASIEWNTVLPPNPDGTLPSTPKNYSGGVTYDGLGPTASPDRFEIEFPYNPETVADAVFVWRAVMVAPDGTVTEAGGGRPLGQVSAVLAVRGLLRPSGDGDRSVNGARNGDHAPPPAIDLLRARRSVSRSAGIVLQARSLVTRTPVG